MASTQDIIFTNARAINNLIAQVNALNTFYVF